MNLNHTIRTAKSVITANSPVLLVSAAVVGAVTTGILAAQAGYKARGIIDAEEAARTALPESQPLTFQDKTKLTWLCYAAPAVTGISTVSSIVGLHLVHVKKFAGLAGLYAVTAGKLDDARDKAEELLGTKKSQTLNDALGQKAVDAHPIVNNEVIITGEATELMFDELSGRYYMGSVPMVEQAVAKTNIRLAKDGDRCLNEFYDDLGIPPIPMGTQLGWSGEDIDVRFGSVQTSDGRSAVSVSFRKEPTDKLGVV